jgi:hypothetical protein
MSRESQTALSRFPHSCHTMVGVNSSMITKFRILILAVSGLAALAVFRSLWTRTFASPTELRVHVSFLALGYTFLFGTGLQELVRTTESQARPELRTVTVLRLLAAIASTVGYLFGILWAVKYGRHDALWRPVLLTDSIVVGVTWFVAVKPFRDRPTAYWDIALGFGAFSSWFLAAMH